MLPSRLEEVLHPPALLFVQEGDPGSVPNQRGVWCCEFDSRCAHSHGYQVAALSDWFV